MRSPAALIRAAPGVLAPHVVLAAATLAVAFVLRYPSLFEPRWYGDEGIFAAIAENVRHGRTLYGEAWDNKPPLIFLTYAGVQRLFGAGVLPLHGVTTGVALATQCVVMGIAAAIAGVRRAPWAGLAFAFATGTPIIEGNLAVTETYMILPASLGVLVFVIGERAGRGGAWTCALAGLLLGLAAGYKQVAVFDAAAVALMVWLTHERPMRALAPMAAGFATPHAFFALYFAASGAFPDYVYAMVGSLGLYAELGPAQDPLMRFAGYLPALLAVAWLARRRQLGGEVTAGDFPALWLAFALAGVTSSSFSFPHYLLQAAPPFAVAVAVASLPRPEDDDLARVVWGVAAVLAFALVVGQFSFAFRERRQLDPIDYYRTFVSHRWGTMSDLDYKYAFDGKVVAVDDISSYIERDGAGETLYTWSELPWLYPATGLGNPSRYYTSFLGEVVPGAREEILRDLEEAPPAYVVISDSSFAPFTELERFVEERYALLRAQGDWRLYRLKTATGRLDPEG